MYLFSFETDDTKGDQATHAVPMA